MIRCIKYVLIVVFIVLATLTTIIVLNKWKSANIKNNNSIEDKIVPISEEELEIRKSFYKEDSGLRNLLLPLAGKNGNWQHYPLTRHFKEKFNEKDGVLGNIEFDKVEFCLYKEGAYPFSTYPHYVITKGNEKIVYQFNWKTDEDEYGVEAIDDIIFLSSPIKFTDSNGHELDTRLRCTEENWKEILMTLAHGNEEKYNSIAFTDKFNSQYISLNDLISKKTNESGACYGYKSNDFKNKIAECYWYTKSGDKILKIKFLLDDREYIDDIEVLSSELLKK